MRTFLLLFLPMWNLAASPFPVPYNSEREPATPMPASEAVARMTLPPGFKATVFAAEPDVQNPIALAWDGRGRLWVAENYTYSERGLKFDLRLRDRILVFEDENGDGHFDSRTVFTDEVQMLTSIEAGRGGIWAMCPPQLLFIHDSDGDDVPDGAPEVVLDGFAVPPENYHNFANGLRFGPDGWLYGRCGASSPGELGAPGSPQDERIPMRGTMWRYHPERKIVEALSCGTTNPWGHDWNEHGELFFINTVNGHLWHGFAGSHLVRPHTIDPNPRVYGLIDQHADHWHFDTAVGWSKSRDGIADAFGGGHAHIGMMIYLGDNWPAEYHGRLFTWNMHGRRANQEILERRGSGYVGRHGPDLFQAADPFFRGMELSYGPDGAVFVLDWSDTGECHESTGVHRTSGRIYRISYGDPKPGPVVDLGQLSAGELVKLHTHANEWFSRQARIELTTRAVAGRDVPIANQQLRALYTAPSDVVIKLRALWSLYAIGTADQTFLRSQLHHPNEHIRTWAIRLLSDTWPLDTVFSRRPARASAADQLTKPSKKRAPEVMALSFVARLAPSAAEFSELVRLARDERSGLVRLALASTLQRLPVSQRAELAAVLAGRTEDAGDHNLPLMIWYGLIPVAESAPGSLVHMAAQCELAITRRFIARRLVEEIDSHPEPLNGLLQIASAKSDAFKSDILHGLSDGLTGWRKAKKPPVWDAFARSVSVASDSALRDRVRELSVVFGDGRALEEVKKIALDQDAPLAARKTALQTLIDNAPPDLREICERLLSVRFLNPVAARGLAKFDDEIVAGKLVRAYQQFHPSERPQLLATLVSRSVFAAELLDAVGEKRISRATLSPFHARQIRSLNDATLQKKLAEVWGEIRESAADKQELIAHWKRRLTSETLMHADKAQGRMVFNATCATCHTLYGEGAKMGPDLTGSGRDNLDYLLENIADPSAVVTADYRMSIIDLKDGRTLTGIVAGKTGRTLTIQTMTETLTIEQAEIEALQQSTLSIMPEGLLESLTPAQVRNLIAYLMHQSQVPLP